MGSLQCTCWTPQINSPTVRRGSSADRAAQRDESQPGRMLTEFLSARDSTGELVAPSWELVIRREGFAARLEG